MQKGVPRLLVITVGFLVGAFERFDDTLRKFIFDNFSLAATGLAAKPKMMSPMGEDAEDSSADTKPKSANAWMKYINQNFVRFKTISSVHVKNQSGSPDFSEKLAMTTIDVFGTTPQIQWIIANEVENQLFQKLPNNSTRILKTNGTENSAIARFDRLTLDWREIGAIESTGIVHQLTAEIGVHYQKSRT